MKLKNYLSKKQRKRKNSQSQAKPSEDIDSNANSMIINYEKEPHAIYAKDDSFLNHSTDGVVQLRDKSAAKLHNRRAMTQSLITDFPSNSDHHRHTTDSSCQTTRRAALSCQFDDYNRLSMYKDSRRRVEIIGPCCNHLNPSTIDSSFERISCHACYQYQRSLSSNGHYNSLPLTQAQPCRVADNKQYNSLPSSLTQSCYVSSSSQLELLPDDVRQQRLTRCRSRIRTNPWLPLPKVNTSLQRRENPTRRAEPRLSRFISEVEEIMREQFAQAEELPCQSISGSKESLASTCSTATEIPEKQTDVSPMRSPSEGYKSACDSECNSGDIDSYNSDDLTDSLSSSVVGIDGNTRSSTPSRSPPTLKDFKITYNQQRGNAKVMTSSTSIMSDSMMSSSISIKSDALQERVRKLCQSTTELDEKMRLARLESSYIQVK